MKKIIIPIIVLLSVFFAYASVDDLTTFMVHVTDADGNSIPNQEDTHNITIVPKASTCPNNAVYSNITTATSNAEGRLNISFYNINLNLSNYRLCYYRSGILKSDNPIASVPYADRVKYVDNESINSSDDYNFNNIFVTTINGVSPLDLNDSTFNYNQTAPANTYTDAQIGNVNLTSNILILLLGTYLESGNLNLTINQLERDTNVSTICSGALELLYGSTGGCVDSTNWDKDSTDDLLIGENSTIARQGTDTQTCPSGEVAQNITIVSNSSGIFVTSWQCATDQTGLSSDNYTVDCSVSGTTTKTATCSRITGSNYTFVWEDLDTDTDTNNYTLDCSVSGTTTKTATCSRNGMNNFTFSWEDLDTTGLTSQQINDSISDFGTKIGFNSTYNETYALYAYNHTAIANSYTDEVNVSQFNWINSVFLKISDMFTKINIVNMISGNRTESEAALRAEIEGNYTTLDTSKLNITDQRYNDTTLINSVNTTENIEGLNFYNTSQVDSLVGSAVNPNTTFNFMLGATVGTYNGNITNGSLIGYEAANAICNAEISGSHFCLEVEIMKTNIINSTITGQYWMAKGAPGYTAAANDCEGWTKITSEIGAFWDFTENSGVGSGKLTPCSSLLKLACCGG